MRIRLLRSGREAHVESHVPGRPDRAAQPRGRSTAGEPVQIAGCADAAVVNEDLKFAAPDSALKTPRAFRNFNSPLKSETRNLSWELRPPEEGS